MIKSKKQMFIVIGIFALILLVGTVTYAFFNYTKTGGVNLVRTGNMSFNAEQGDVVTLSDLFPITTNGNVTSSTPGVGNLSVHVTGSTDYTGGIEYLVKAVNVTDSNGTTLPISISISYEANGQGKTIGTEDEEYFEHRGGNTSVYKVLSNDTIENNGDLVVGYIAPGQTGIDGNIVIMAYLDANNIAITDTIEDGAIVVPGLDNGTTSTWIDGRTVFTTEQWNELQSNGISFQIKVEANEGVWVRENRTVNKMGVFPTTIDNHKDDIKEVYFNKMGATNMQTAYDTATIKADITSNNEGKVLAWLVPDTVDNTKYILYVASDGDTYLTSGMGLFSSWSNVEKIEFNNINTSLIDAVTGMFSGCSSLQKLDLSSFDFSNVAYMSGMLGGCTSLQEIDLSSLTAPTNQGGFTGVFAGLSALETIYVSTNFDISGLYQDPNLFNGCTSLVGGNGTVYDSTKVGADMAIIDGTNGQPGYLTNVTAKPRS